MIVPKSHAKRRFIIMAIITAFFIAVVPVALAQDPPDGGGYKGPVLKRPVIKLLEIISGSGEIDVEPGVQTWLNYFETIAEWLFTLAIGFCVMWVLIGAIRVMVAADNQGERDKGIDGMKSAVFGLIILSFAGLILRTLNNLFFV